jgi:pantoate--beta-alanine ligase
VLFLPSVEEMYPKGTKAAANYDLGDLEFVLEGEYRPGHFQGVSQVVNRLLDIVKPDILFLGQKDFQQCLVIKKLLEQLQMPVSLNIAETMREPSGLAMSSRNMRLSEEERKKAAAIYECLVNIQKEYTTTDLQELITSSKKHLLNSGFTKVDYVAIANADTLELTATPKPQIAIVALIAAYLGEVRLIDNMILNATVDNIKS